MNMIKVESLNKNIKGKAILKDISFEVAEGECVALIGPNGAGKTTLLDCLLGDKLVTSGQVSIQGLSVTSSQLDYIRGYLPQENVIVQKLKVKELIAFFQSIYPNPLSNQEINQLLQFDQQQKEQLAEKLSGGQKRLFSFVLTLIGRPKLVFLDEPTAAMDTSTRQRFWEIVQELKAKGVTILYSSHYIEEVEHTADRILVLNKGELIRDTTPLAMRSEEIEKHFILPLAYKEVVEQSNLVENWSQKQDALQVVTREADAFWQLLVQAGCRIQEIEVNNRSLLDTIFEETQKEMTKMKRWIALNKIEFLLTKRQLVTYLLSVGMPTAFYLFFSGMYQDTPDGPANFMRDYLISMTAFSMMSTAMFSFPAVLHTDKINNWQKTLRHTPVNMVEYYLSKITSMMVDYLVSILVVFSVGHLVRGVDMPLGSWIGAALLLIVGSVAFVALGLTLTLLPSSQLMSVVGNLLYLGLAVLGGLWMPISLFPDWMQAIGKCLPTYQLMELLKTFLNEDGINLSATVYLLVFSTVLFGLTIYLQGHKENA